MNHWLYAGVILGVVLINAIIGYLQEEKARKALEGIIKLLALKALVIRNGSLKLDSDPSTKIIFENSQLFTESIANHQLIVVFGPSTRSIPVKTTSYQIFVLFPWE